MSVIKKWLSALLILSCIFSIHSLYSAELTVKNISIKDRQTLEIILNENPNMLVGTQEDSEIVVLEDIKLVWGLISSVNTRQIELKTVTPLLPNTRYSLLTLSGTEGSIDFETPSWVEWFKTSNFSSMKNEDISSIEIINENTILINYRQNLTWFNYSFKLFAEVGISEVRKNDFQVPILTLIMDKVLASETNYILMFIDIRDAKGDILDFNTGIYDFKTELFDEEITDDMAERDLSIYQDEELTPEEIALLEVDILAGEIPLQGAPEDLEEGNLEEIAQKMPETYPEAWSTTGILILLTLIINTFFYKARIKRSILV